MQQTPAEYQAFLASLPRAFAAASAVVTDPEGRLLLVRCFNRPQFGPPGGVVEAGESPPLAAERELEEEVGLRLTAKRLLAVSWITAGGTGVADMPGCQLFFDMGTVPAGVALTLQATEVAEAAWVAAAELAPLTGALRAERLTSALAARAGGEVRVVVSSRLELDDDARRLAAG